MAQTAIYYLWVLPEGDGPPFRARRQISHLSKRTCLPYPNNSKEYLRKWLWPLPTTEAQEGQRKHAENTCSQLRRLVQSSCIKLLPGNFISCSKAAKDSVPRLGRGGVDDCCAPWWPLALSTKAQNSEVHSKVAAIEPAGCPAQSISTPAALVRDLH